MQFLMDAVAKWGSMLLLVMTGIPAIRLWGLMQRRRELTRQGLLRAVVKDVWWIVTFAILIWVLEVRLAPLTRSLVTLQAGRGERVPDISFRSASDGSLHHLGEFKGKVLLLNLWATYCPPCIKELPVLARLQAVYRDRGLVVIALSDESAEAVTAFLTEHPVQLLGGSAESLDWLKLEAFRPMSVVIDRQGILRTHFFGDLDYDGFEEFVRPFL